MFCRVKPQFDFQGCTGSADRLRLKAHKKLFSRREPPFGMAESGSPDGAFFTWDFLNLPTLPCMADFDTHPPTGSLSAYPAYMEFVVLVFCKSNLL